MTLEELKAEALKLSPEEQARLADAIAEHLHGSIDPAIEQAHLEEVDRRYKAHREGKMASRPKSRR